jgi:hypothetical protein
LKIPRKRKGRGSKEKKAPKKAPSKKAQEAIFSEEQYGLDLYHGFMRSDEDVIAISYRVNTGNIAKEEIVNKYKSQMISALMKVGRRRGVTIPVQQIRFQALPLGEDSIIKAYALVRSATKLRDGAPARDARSDDPFQWRVDEGVERALNR